MYLKEDAMGAQTSSRSGIALWVVGIAVTLFTSELLLPGAAYTQPLSLQVTISPNPVRQGELLTYNYTIGNEGPSTLTNIVLTDVFPNFVEVVSQGGGFCPPSGGCSPGAPISWNRSDLGDLAPGEATTIRLVLRVKDTAGSAPPNGTILSSRAQVSSASGELTEVSQPIVVDSTQTLKLSVVEDR